MSNIFKPHNSRFSILNEDVELNYKNKNNKIDKSQKNKNDAENKNNRYNNFTSSSRRSKFHEDTEKNKVPPLPTVNDINSFPELTTNITKTVPVLEDNQKQSFLEKLKTVKDEIATKKIEEIIKDGCVSITFKNRNTTYKYGKISYVPDDVKKTSPQYIMSNLVNIHVKRTEDYINLWGYDDYEKLFLSPNYDYEYFDKLDEQYELEMEKLELEENEIVSEENYY